MRTTLTIDDELLRQAKERAARSHKTVSEVVEDAMREAFARRATAGGRIPIADLPTSPGGPRPGVDLNNNAALSDLLDEEDDELFRAGP
ncbi:MAG TPA: DUF6364 family protein [Mycobacteriales bacterium]|nr:DUF6364 family protein [Mycobacteriales bacterium]